MAKDITFEPMAKMLVGFDKVAEAVIGTLGPKGRNVFIDDPMAPKITNDGATIAIHSQLQDKIENMGAHIIRNTSSQTNDDVGDATTTTAVFTHAIVHACLERPENPMVLRKSLQEASKKAVKELQKVSVPVKDEDIEKVALISAEDKHLASLITGVIKKKGKSASITVEDSDTTESYVYDTQGYEANVGYMSPYFITDMKRSKAVQKDVYVLVSEKRISTLQELKPLLDTFAQSKVGSLVIVCEDIDPSMLGIFVNNKLQGNFNSLVIRATGPVLLDIEAAVGATRVSETTGVNFDTLTLEHLGKAKKVESDANKTIFIASSPLSAQMRANELEKQAEQEPNMYIKERTTDRVAKLRGGVAVLRVGAPTDFDREYLKLKADDTIKATKAAIAEGIVEGGGMTWFRIASRMKAKTPGEQILKKILTSPLKTIIRNAGLDYTEIVLNMPEGMGFDARDEKYVDMLKAGIIDPTKAERVALENAVSAASTFITTFATVTDHVEEPKK